MLKESINNNFIESYHLSNLKICDEFIDIFYKSEQKQGTIGSGQINKKVKDSLDFSLNINDQIRFPTLKHYLKELIEMLNLYKDKYKYCEVSQAAWGIENNFNIQKYKPTQAYHGWHSEVCNKQNSSRNLAWMTYLNDIKQGGETEWYYQNLKIKPKKGLTVIWPTNWVFTHKGHTTTNENKYIITGWCEYK